MASAPVVIRLPRTAYLAVVFLFIGAVVIAFGDSNPHGLQGNKTGSGSAGFSIGPQALVLLVPILAAVFIARTATACRAGCQTRRSRFPPQGFTSPRGARGSARAAGRRSRRC